MHLVTPEERSNKACARRYGDNVEFDGVASCRCRRGFMYVEVKARRSLPPSHTHIHTYTHTHSLSHTHTHSLSLSLSLEVYLPPTPSLCIVLKFAKFLRIYMKKRKVEGHVEASETNCADMLY